MTRRRVKRKRLSIDEIMGWYLFLMVGDIIFREVEAEMKRWHKRKRKAKV